MNNKHGTRHQFFLYLAPHLTPHTLGSSPVFSCKDSALFQRVHKVLRLRAGDSVTFFTGANAIDVSLTSSVSGKDTVTGTITAVVPTEPHPHSLTAAISLLKKDALEAAAYSAAQMGAAHITPIITAKSRDQYLNSREEERLQSMIIAACEQSKNPRIPKLNAPRTLESLLSQQKRATTICFDHTGTPLIDLAQHLAQEQPVKTCVLIGPEGGFTPDELTMITNSNALTAQLTNTILRSRDAACLGFGVISSLLLK